MIEMIRDVMGAFAVVRGHLIRLPDSSLSSGALGSRRDEGSFLSVRGP